MTERKAGVCTEHKQNVGLVLEETDGEVNQTRSSDVDWEWLKVANSVANF